MGSVALIAGGSGTDFRIELSGAGSKARLASGTLSGASARPAADASAALAVGAGLRTRTVVRCASACSHFCQCVAPIWRSGLPLYCRSWKACSKWYTASWSFRSAGSAAAGNTPGYATCIVPEVAFQQEDVVFALSSALTITRAQSSTRITASGTGRRSGSQTAMCASAGPNMQTTHFGLCCPRCATGRVALRQACVMSPAWRSGTSMVWMASPRHAACRCSSWSGLQTSVGGLARPGSCRLLGALMVCSRTASG